MRVLLTGASGFIGSHIARALVDSGHTVLAFVMPEDDLWRLNDVLGRIELLKGNLQQVSNVRSDLWNWRPQACIHLAWYAEPGKYLYSKENINSLYGSLDLLQILYESGCEQFIGAGTCAEYEMKSDFLGEDDPTNPETLYAAAKLSFKLLGEQLAGQYGRKFAWGRIFYLYGSYEDHRRLVPAAILKMLKAEVFLVSPGEQVRDFLHVYDVANAFVKIMEQKASGTYNICSAEPISVKVLLNTIGDMMDRSDLFSFGELPYREWEPMFICGKNDRLKSIGWSSQLSLRAGLQNTISWWKNQQEKKNEISN